MLQELWQSVLNFVFYYPLFMSYLWMMGALIFYVKERKDPAFTGISFGGGAHSVF